MRRAIQPKPTQADPSRTALPSASIHRCSNRLTGSVPSNWAGTATDAPNPRDRCYWDEGIQLWLHNNSLHGRVPCCNVSCAARPAALPALAPGGSGSATAASRPPPPPPRSLPTGAPLPRLLRCSQFRIAVRPGNGDLCRARAPVPPPPPPQPLHKRQQWHDDEVVLQVGCPNSSMPVEEPELQVACQLTPIALPECPPRKPGAAVGAVHGWGALGRPGLRALLASLALLAVSAAAAALWVRRQGVPRLRRQQGLQPAALELQARDSAHTSSAGSSRTAGSSDFSELAGLLASHERSSGSPAHARAHAPSAPRLSVASWQLQTRSLRLTADDFTIEVDRQGRPVLLGGGGFARVSGPWPKGLRCPGRLHLPAHLLPACVPGTTRAAAHHLDNLHACVGPAASRQRPGPPTRPTHTPPGGGRAFHPAPRRSTEAS